MSNNAQTLQNVTSVDGFLNVAATETVPLFEYLSFRFLLEYDVFAPCKRGRTRVHEPPELFRGFLHCYYEDVYGTRPVARELQKPLVWLSCGFDRPPSRDAVDRFLTDLEHVVDEIFDRLVKQAARRGLPDLTYCIYSTEVKAMPADQDASECYDPIEDEYYHGYGCAIVLLERYIHEADAAADDGGAQLDSDRDERARLRGVRRVRPVPPRRGESGRGLLRHRVGAGRVTGYVPVGHSDRDRAVVKRCSPLVR